MQGFGCDACLAPLGVHRIDKPLGLDGEGRPAQSCRDRIRYEGPGLKHHVGAKPRARHVQDRLGWVAIDVRPTGG